MEIVNIEKESYLISTDKSLLNMEIIHDYLSRESYWAKNIPIEIVRQSIENSLCFGVYHQQEQIGFARIISDFATIAYLGDVFILKNHRKTGLSKWLMEVVISHPELQGLRRWVLATADAHTLYEKFGFTSLTKPERWMEKFNPEVYSKN